MRLCIFSFYRLSRNNALGMTAALSYRTIFAMVPALVLALLVLKSLGVLGSPAEALRRVMTASGFAQISVMREGEPSRHGGMAPAQPPNPSESPSPAPPGPPPASQPTTAPAIGPDALAALGPVMLGSPLDMAAAGALAAAEDITRQETEVRQQARLVNLADTLERIVNQVQEKLTFGRIGPIGVALLVWTALTLLSTMERSLNSIFDAPASRSLWRRVLLYWSAVTLAPVLLVVAMYIGRQAEAASQQWVVLRWLAAVVSWLAPGIVGVLVLGGLYKLMPNTHVPFAFAALGAVAVVPVWMVAKWAFGLYVGYFTRHASLYGALGVVPLFLLWVNLSWWFFLLGAQVAHTAANVDRLAGLHPGDRLVISALDMLAVAVAVAEPFHAGKGPVEVRQIAARVRLPLETVQRLLRRLTDGDVLLRVERRRRQAYSLARPPETISLRDMVHFVEADGRAGLERFEPQIARAIGRIADRAEKSLDQLTLADALASGA
jgi:YihY family inner membrane protein